MSASILADEHTASIIMSAQRLTRGRGRVGMFDWFADELAIAHILREQNRRSVAYRYNEPAPDVPSEPPTHLRGQYLSTVALIKACDCYDYQACETPDYERTDAAKIVDGLRRMAIAALPGYDEAEWCISTANPTDRAFA